MRTHPEPPVPIDVSQLVVGLYVWIDLPWTEHPFLTSRRMIESARDIALIRRARPHGLLYYYPQRSRVQPPPAVPAHASPNDTATGDAVQEEFERLREDKRRRLRQQLERAARMRQGWERAARQLREALQEFARTPRSAGERLHAMAHETALQVMQGEALLLQTLAGHLTQGAQHHAMNVMLLSLLVGRRAGLGATALTDLAMAALAHDAGQSDMPAHLLRKRVRRPFEEDFYRQHVALSVQLAAQSGHFSAAAQTLIAQHHEAADGSGWPTGRRDAEKGARILAMADRFDRLCNPVTAEVAPLSPAEALAQMVRLEAARFDGTLLGLFIQVLGVHPPGSWVQLSDGALAIVVSPGEHPATPRVRLPSPGLTPEEAPEIDLATQPGLQVLGSWRESDLPQDVRSWGVSAAGYPAAAR
ncbi:MAG: hypothetical protein RIQ96_2055 [Pseudomonadota bacterium]